MTTFGTPYWWEDGADLPDLPTNPPRHSDFTIIGAGYTGLSAAITAQRAGAKVLVLDAGVPGQGASTRNGGMIGVHTRILQKELVRSFGVDAADALLREAPSAFAFTKGLIETEKIDCDLQLTGRIVLAWTKSGQAELVDVADQMQRQTGTQLQVVDHGSIGDHINTNRYFGGIVYKDHGGLQPRKFHDGLLEIALREGVQIVQNCRVTGIKKSLKGFEIAFSNGVIHSEKMIVATNGYTRKPFGWLTKRFFPLPSFIIATEQLPPDVITQIAPGRHMMVETRSKHSYFRISPDGTRVIFGGRASMLPISPEFAAKRLRATMIDIWPQLRDVKITHSWRGYTGFSFEQMPHVGQQDGYHFAMGYSGSGVALAPYLGMKLAYQALGDSRGETAYSLTTPQTRWFHPGGWPYFLGAGELWYRQVADRLENRQAARDGRDQG